LHGSLRQRLARQEIILLEGALRFTGPHAVTGRSSQPGKTNRISSYTCPYSTGPCSSLAPARSTAAWRSGAMASHWSARETGTMGWTRSVRAGRERASGSAGYGGQYTHC